MDASRIHPADKSHLISSFQTALGAPVTLHLEAHSLRTLPTPSFCPKQTAPWACMRGAWGTRHNFHPTQDSHPTHDISTHPASFHSSFTRPRSCLALHLLVGAQPSLTHLHLRLRFRHGHFPRSHTRQFLDQTILFPCQRGPDYVRSSASSSVLLLPICVLRSASSTSLSRSALRDEIIMECPCIMPADASGLVHPCTFLCHIHIRFSIRSHFSVCPRPWMRLASTLHVL